MSGKICSTGANGEKMRIIFVCMGNICRSPTAEGVMRRLAENAGVGGQFELDSAGTHSYHVGNPPDTRSQRAAAQRGYDLSGMRARQIGTGDFSFFDLVLAMDRDNLDALHRVCPPQFQHKLGMFLAYAEGRTEQEMPDPYYGGPDGFEQVLDLAEAAARGLIARYRGS